MMEKKWWQKEVVYQIYSKSFYDSNQDGIGDIKGITEKLYYLKNLGVTMLWLCPVFKSPMDDNGYDISDYLQLAPEFGTMEDLEQLISEAGQMGIKIILDLVINHSSDEHAWFQEALKNPESPYHDYYIFKPGDERPNNWRSIFGGSVWEKVEGRDEYYYHTFGKKQPDLNWENETLRKELYQMVNTWLDKGIAGFRIDAITFIKKDLTFGDQEPDGVDGLSKCTKSSRNQKGIGLFLKELNNETFSRHTCMTVAEAPGVSYDQLDEFVGDNGYFNMIFDFKAADLDVASGSEWFKRINWSISDLKDKIFSCQLAIQKCGWAANFIENHDQPRATTKLLKEQHRNTDGVKMLGAMYFFLRGTPFIYQGQELGMVNFVRDSADEFNDISSIDQYGRGLQEGLSEQEALHAINLRSRDNARTPFPWNGGLNGGFSKITPWLKMTETYSEINVEQQMGQENSVLEFYKEMIQFRQFGRYSDCLIYGSILPIETRSGEVIAYERKYEGQKLYCYFNFSRQSVEECVPAESMRVVFNNLNDAALTERNLTLKPFQSLILVEENNREEYHGN